MSERGWGESRWVDAVRAVFLGAAASAPASALLMLPAVGIGIMRPPLPLVIGLLVWGGLAVAVYRSTRAGRRALFVLASEVLVFVILPLWGMTYSHAAEGACEVSECDAGVMPFRPLAEPELVGLIALQVGVAVAYGYSRRSTAMSRRGETLALAMMMFGVVEHVLLGVQFGGWNLMGLAIAPIFLPCLTPALSVILLVTEIRRRSALAPEGLVRRGLVFTPGLMAIYAAIHTAWLGGWGAAVAVFTRTCDYPLSSLPVVVIPQTDCHYLCTVAARGHPWLVRPQRLGRRRGVVIVVNRQLAVANAFEDLLHERWPRFGAFARRSYDAVGLPVSRWIRAAWMSDLVYLAMKPAEWCFYLTLRALDPGDPEARIDRMYR